MSSTRTVNSSHAQSADALQEILSALDGCSPKAVVFFASLSHDGALIGRALQERFPKASILGCSSNGEFSDRGFGKGGLVAMSLGEDVIARCALAMADVSGDIEQGVQNAARRIEARLGQPLRSLDSERWAGLALLEGARGREEQINAALGNMAPFLPFVGGSAGDNITFSGTWTFADGMLLRDGTAVLVAEMQGPFRFIKACNFVPTEHAVTVTRTVPERRLIVELDGQPAADFFARKLDVDKQELRFEHFLAHPLGLMIDGEAWLRSGVRVEGDALFFACSVVEGARLHFMQATDLVEDSRAKLARAMLDLGGPVHGGIFFNCAYRMLEAQIKGQEAAYHHALSMLPHIGMQSNGESYLGHINQTLTGLIF